MKGTYKNNGTLYIPRDFSKLDEARSGAIGWPRGFSPECAHPQGQRRPEGAEDQTLPAAPVKQPWGSPSEGRETAPGQTSPTPPRKRPLQIFLGGLVSPRLKNKSPRQGGKTEE